MAKLAIIGGSGIKDSPLFRDATWYCLGTGYPNGECFETSTSTPSLLNAPQGVVEFQEVANVLFIPRHGRDESLRYGPSATQYAANLITAKLRGATAVIGLSAVGSLKPTIKVKDLVIPHDYVDDSRRNDNIWGQGIVVHANPIPPFSEELRRIVRREGEGLFPYVHNEAVYVTIPGDRFGTVTEGKIRSQYADVVGMTLSPEAAMALSLGMHYACVAFPVDENLDANHEGGTLKVMGELSEVVPTYVSRLVEKAVPFAKQVGPLEQLVGNIIPGKLDTLKNKYLRDIAQELIHTYCR